MELPEINLLGFIGAEETNLLVSMVDCHRDVDLPFRTLDGAYQAPIQFIDIAAADKHKEAVLTLYLFVHYHLYLSTVSLLRCHLSDSLASTRKAIDATLTAYRLIEFPDTLSQYKERHRHYQNIKGHIARIRRGDASKYVLAEELIRLHELCSEYGSHADISGFVHRVLVEQAGKGKWLYRLNMFQMPESVLERRAYVVQTLLAFTQMLKVFAGFVGSVAVGLDVPAWNSRIAKVEAGCAKESQQIDAQIKNAAKK